MTVFFVCFNLSDPLDQQTLQISYWLDFLNSSLPLPHHYANPSSNLMPSSKIIIIGLQSDRQKEFDLTENPQQMIAAWKKRWSRLPISPMLFSVSSLTSTESVIALLQFVESECNQIFSQYCVQIPSLYRKVLALFKSRPVSASLVHWKDLLKQTTQEDEAKDMTEPAFRTMLRYFESIGRIVWLPTGWVFTDPTIAPKIIAKFISPREVRLMLLKQETDNVQILDMSEVGCLLDIDTSNNDRLHRELELMVHLQICFELRVAGKDSPYYLFPSLSSEAGTYKKTPFVVNLQFSNIQIHTAKR